MFKYFILIVFSFLSFELFSNESLTLKQQLDRLQREVNDLSQSVFTNSNIKPLDKNKNETLSTNLTTFDLRIYDLEKEIKKLNENFEELIFQIDDLEKLYENLNLSLSTKLLIQDKNQKSEDLNNDFLSEKDLNKTNTLGTLTINSEDLTITDEKVEILKNEIELSSEEEFQLAFDMIRNQKFADAKSALKNFIKKHNEDKLAGSAHYWLGEIYILKKEYREAALILAEGYQNFPLSFKAPDMLFKLSNSLIEIDKKKDACGTLEKLIKEFPKHKLIYNAKENLIAFGCAI